MCFDFWVGSALGGLGGRCGWEELEIGGLYPAPHSDGLYPLLEPTSPSSQGPLLDSRDGPCSALPSLGVAPPPRVASSRALPHPWLAPFTPYAQLCKLTTLETLLSYLFGYPVSLAL